MDFADLLQTSDRKNAIATSNTSPLTLSISESSAILTIHPDGTFEGDPEKFKEWINQSPIWRNNVTNWLLYNVIKLMEKDKNDNSV